MIAGYFIRSKVFTESRKLKGKGKSRKAKGEKEMISS